VVAVTTPEIVRRNIKDLIEAYLARGGSQTSLAREIGVKQGQISTWLNSEFTPHVDSWDGIARVFKISVNDLLTPSAVTKAFGAKASPAESLVPDDFGLRGLVELLRGDQEAIEFATRMVEGFRRDKPKKRVTSKSG
jgi:transcriptional regulator with XRE-family HTH domain